jgi:transglutaminase-like putative cysteine protease
MRYLLIIVFVVKLQQVYSQSENKLSCELIPAELRSNANAVVRNSQIILEVKELNEVIYVQKKTITILNKAGKDYATCILLYDPSIRVKEIRAALYDKYGNLLHKIPASQFIDASYINDFSLFEDNRVKYFIPSCNNYPFTVTYEYEIKLRNSLTLPEWVPQEAHDVSVEKSSFMLTFKNDHPLRIREYNYGGIKLDSIGEKGEKIYKWHVSGITAFRKEKYAPPKEESQIRVIPAPMEFIYEGIQGKFSNWEEYGLWTYEHLIKGRDQLSNQTIAKINDLIRNLTTPKEKAEKIYEYVQNTTRYVSIQKGIGGLQPMHAKEVDRLGYGDCKALTNFTMSLLKIAGITSHYAEIYGGQDPKNISEDFASLQGNHVILCIPFDQDTVWLECTDPHSPFGYIGTFTDNRTALLCTAQGGIIAKTRSYLSTENSIRRTGTFSIDQTGHLEGKLTSIYKGVFFQHMEEASHISGKRRMDLISEMYPIVNLQVKGYDIELNRSSSPSASEFLEFSSQNYGNINNNRLLFFLNNVCPYKNALQTYKSRINPIWIPRGFVQEETYEYQLPENFHVEVLPQGQEVKNNFGTFFSSARIEDHKLFYNKKLHLKEGRYSASEYQDLLDLLNKAEISDHKKLVLISKVR